MVTMQIMRALAERRSIVVVSDLLYKLAFYIKLGVHQLSEFIHDLWTYNNMYLRYISTAVARQHNGHMYIGTRRKMLFIWITWLAHGTAYKANNLLTNDSMFS